MNRLTKGKGLFGAVTLDGGATLIGNRYGNIDFTGYSKVAAGSNGLYYQVTQITGTALTGTLRGAYIVATNGTSAASGTVRGLDVKARAANSSNVGANVAKLEGITVSVDVKNKTVTDVRGIEVALDGGAGGAATTVYGMEISNNTSATFTTVYGLAFNFGTASGHGAFTKDILLQNGETIDNATNGTVQITANVLKLAYDALAYMTITQADGAGVTFASVSDGTAGFTFSQSTSFTAGLNVNTNRFAIASTGDFTSINQEADATGTTWNLTKSRAAYAACSNNDVIFEMNASAYNNNATPATKLVATMQAIVTDVTDTSEDGAFVFKTMVAGAAAAEKFRISNIASFGTDNAGIDVYMYGTGSGKYLKWDATNNDLVMVGDDFDLKTDLDTETIRLNSRNYAATSGDIIGFQSKPAANADGTQTVYGGQISPRFNDGVDGASLVGLQIEPILKGATAAALSGDVRALDVRLSDDGNAGHTVGGHVAGIKLYNLLKSGTFTGGVYPFVITEAGDTQAWSALMEIPVSLSGAANGGGADVYIPITINGVPARISAKYVS